MLKFTDLFILSVLCLVFPLIPAEAFDGVCPDVNNETALDLFKTDIATNLMLGATEFPAVESRMKDCFTGKTIPACLKRTQDFLHTRWISDSVALDTRAAEDAHKQPPSEMISTLAKDGSLQLESGIEALALAKGWPVVRYKSRHAGGFDPSTPSLMMIRVPGDKLSPPTDYDRYLNFPIPADETVEALNPIPQKNPALSPIEIGSVVAGTTPSIFTIVTVKKATANTQSEIYFQRYMRNNQTWAPEVATNLKNCYTCHPNGLRAISPLGYHVRKLPDGTTERQMPPDAWKQVQAMNDSMLASTGDKLTDWRGAQSEGAFRSFLDGTGVGPTIGPTIPLTRFTKNEPGHDPVEVPLTRQKEFILGGVLNGVTYPGCYAARPEVDVHDIFHRPPGNNNLYRLTANPPIRWQAVRDAMNCSSCHANRARGALNGRTDFSQIDFKILVDQSMPRGLHLDPMDRGSPRAPVDDPLNPNERIALANCLKVEFQGHEASQFKNWMTDLSCKVSNGATQP